MMRALIFRNDMKTGDSFFRGLTAALYSFSIIRGHKGLLKYLIIPFLLNIFILSAIFFFSYTSLYDPLFSLVKGNAWYNRLLETVLAPLLVLVISIIVVLLYSIIGSVITAPFNDVLSQRVEESLTGERREDEFGIFGIVKDILRIIRNTVKLLGIIVLINMLLLFLNLIPAVGSVMYVVLGFLSASFFFGFQFFDFPLERRRFEFRDKLSVTWHFKRMVAGVGASFFIMTFIPLVGFLGMNIATVAAAKLFIDHIKPALLSERPATAGMPDSGTGMSGS
ncbi:MAG: hypothetical protein A2176_08490 [Spirochaetes bacterium RBG_13_51_14]|nr:MAG: hypothetical protein A2176_08490 [Spirochaetes bacterium RBG_13_51_14]